MGFFVFLHLQASPPEGAFLTNGLKWSWDTADANFLVSSVAPLLWVIWCSLSLVLVPRTGICLELISMKALELQIQGKAYRYLKAGAKWLISGEGQRGRGVDSRLILLLVSQESQPTRPTLCEAQARNSDVVHFWSSQSP